MDSPLIFENQGGGQLKWIPENNSEKFYGDTTLRTAIINSRNVPAVKLLQEIGLGYFTKYLRAVGLSGDFTPVYNDPIYISLLFHGGSVGWGGPLLVGLAVLGALASLRGGTRRSRVFAWTLLVVVGTLVGLRSLLFLSPRWILPPPLYSEIALWPLYAFFASVACCRIAARRRAPT